LEGYSSTGHLDGSTKPQTLHTDHARAFDASPDDVKERRVRASTVPIPVRYQAASTSVAFA